jgi:hypothetical protein
MKLTMSDLAGKREIFHINPVLQAVLYLPLALPVVLHLRSVTLEQATPMPPSLMLVMLCLAVCLYRFLKMTVILSEHGIEFRGLSSRVLISSGPKFRLSGFPVSKVRHRMHCLSNPRRAGKDCRCSSGAGRQVP